MKAMGETVDTINSCISTDVQSMAAGCVSDDFETRLAVFLRHLLFAVLVTLFATITLRIMLPFQKSSVGLVQRYAEFWISLTPFALGIGYAWNSVFIVINTEFAMFYLLDCAHSSHCLYLSLSLPLTVSTSCSAAVGIDTSVPVVAAGARHGHQQ